MIFLSAPPLFSGRLSTGLRLCLWIAQIPKCPQKWKGVLRGLRRMGGLWMVKEEMTGMSLSKGPKVLINAYAYNSKLHLE